MCMKKGWTTITSVCANYLKNIKTNQQFFTCFLKNLETDAELTWVRLWFWNKFGESIRFLSFFLLVPRKVTQI